MRPLLRLYPLDVERVPPAQLRPGLQARILAWDPGSGATTRMLSAESGVLVPPPAGAQPWDEQIYVISGAIELDGERFDAGSYMLSPAGAMREQARVPDGAGPLTALQLCDPAAQAGSGVEPVRLTAGAVERIVREPAAPGGVGGVQRILARTPGGAVARILDAEAYSDTGGLVHDFCEEGIILAGSYKMTWHLGEELHPAGTYTHIPPGVIHGPIANNEPYRCFEVRGGR